LLMLVGHSHLKNSYSRSETPSRIKTEKMRLSLIFSAL
jgi:hypothetical protein